MHNPLNMYGIIVSFTQTHFLYITLNMKYLYHLGECWLYLNFKCKTSFMERLAWLLVTAHMYSLYLPLLHFCLNLALTKRVDVFYLG